MDDLISRQAALDALGKRPTVWTDDNDYAHGMRNQYDMDRLAIETVPPAQPTDEEIQRMQYIEQAMLEKAYWFGKQDAQEWIPCSERLPEDYTNVLVWFEYYRYGNYNRLYQMYGIGNYMAKYDSWMINYETGWRKLRVLAWCPLPEPWKGEQE